MHEMDEFEEQLTRALRRVEAPRGFVERVCAAGEAERPAPRARLRLTERRVSHGASAWMGWALAAGVLLFGLGGEGVHLKREAARRAAVQAQFETAMQVTGKALETTRRQVNRAGVRLDLE